MAEEQNVLKGEQALALARQGAEAWNEWAEKHEGWKVDFEGVKFGGTEATTVEFSRFHFPGPLSFRDVEFLADIGFFGCLFSDGALFYGAIFEGSVSFKRAHFLQEGNFVHTEYKKDVEFSSTKFEGGADFSGSTFCDYAHFDRIVSDESIEFLKVKFLGPAIFFEAQIQAEISFEYSHMGDVFDIRDAEFGNEASFKSCYFQSTLDMDNAKFGICPDFISTRLNSHISMADIEISPLWKKKATSYIYGDLSLEMASRYRRLKEMANLAQDHRQEQNFFAMEQKAMRGTKYTGLAVIPSLLYEIFSDFGRSISRPATWLLGVWLVYGMCYLNAGTKTHETLNPVFEAGQVTSQSLPGFLTSLASSVSTALLYSATQILPFISGAGDVKARAVEKLFIGDVPWYLGWLNITEGIFAFMFLFLMGLALRNRFRI